MTTTTTIEWVDEYSHNDMCHYGSVLVGDTEIGVCVGVPEHLRATCRASGGPNEGYVSAFWADSSDWSDITKERAAELLELVEEQAWRLFCDADVDNDTH